MGVLNKMLNEPGPHQYVCTDFYFSRVVTVEKLGWVSLVSSRLLITNTHWTICSRSNFIRKVTLNWMSLFHATQRTFHSWLHLILIAKILLSIQRVLNKINQTNLQCWSKLSKNLMSGDTELVELTINHQKVVKTNSVCNWSAQLLITARYWSKKVLFN